MIEVGVVQKDPRQCFRDSGIKVLLMQCLKQCSPQDFAPTPPRMYLKPG